MIDDILRVLAVLLLLVFIGLSIHAACDFAQAAVAMYQEGNPYVTQMQWQ